MTASCIGTSTSRIRINTIKPASVSLTRLAIVEFDSDLIQMRTERSSRTIRLMAVLPLSSTGHMRHGPREQIGAPSCPRAKWFEVNILDQYSFLC